MVKRITREGYGTYKPDKKLYHISHGSEVYEYVNWRVWEREVVANPKGLTATRAKEQKDADLDNIEIPVIGINHNHRAPNQVKTVNNSSIPIKTTRVFKPNIDAETAKRLGWRTAEEGKTLKIHKIPMLKDDNR